jgi:hypothetical protein
MSSKSLFSFRQFPVLLWAVVLGLAVSACSTGSLARKLHLEDSSPEAALVYYQGLSRLTPAELTRERVVLGAAPQVPFTQVRLAMLLGHPRVSQDLGKGLALLEAVLKSGDLAASSFHPLARLLADNYLDRIKFESQIEKQGLQLKESQRKTAELQEKLDSLANIEKALIPRPRAVRPDGVKR